jgi:hypothetical protein
LKKQRCLRIHGYCQRAKNWRHFRTVYKKIENRKQLII